MSACKADFQQQEEKRKFRNRLSPCPPISPEYVPQVTGQNEDSVLVWRLPPNLSQSRLCDRTLASNACTIIALKMAEALHLERLSFRFGARERRAVSGRSPTAADTNLCTDEDISSFAGKERPSRSRYPSTKSEDQVAAGGEDLSETEQDCLLQSSQSSESSSDDAENFNCRITRSRRRQRERAEKVAAEEERRRSIDGNLLNALANSILDGNQIHESAVRSSRRGANELNFTIPDAISACDHVFVELDYKTVKGPMKRSLLEYISAAISFWHEMRDSLHFNQSDVFLLLIAHERTVLLLYQTSTRTVGIVDSHSHGRMQGAVIAATGLRDLPGFCSWIVQNIFPESMFKPEDQQEFEISVIRYADLAEKVPVSHSSSSSSLSASSPYATRSQAKTLTTETPRKVRNRDNRATANGSPRKHKWDKREIVPELKGKIFTSPRKRKSKESPRISSSRSQPAEPTPKRKKSSEQKASFCESPDSGGKFACFSGRRGGSQLFKDNDSNSSNC